MTKDDITFSIIGIAAGLILGFLIGNWTSPIGATAPQAANPREPAAASVNAPRESDLPAGHPPVNPGETIPAPPLPAGSESGAMGGAPTSAAASVEAVSLPSLDPLPASSREERAEKKYKNIQMLKGLPADRIESIMNAFKNSLGVDCTYCHVKDQPEKDDKPTKQAARKMITLTREANAKLSMPRVSCFTCHRGHPKPED